MQIQRVALALTAINLVLLAGSVTQARSSAAPAIEPVLRARMLELVDDRGRLRSRLNVEADGTVVFRLFDQTGTIRVKLGADQNGSGLVMTDETTEPGVHIDGRQQVVTP
jgi:hypothetical protein